MAQLCYAAKFDPFLGHPGVIQGNEGIQFCHLATLRTTRNPPPSHTLFCCPPLTEAEGSGSSSGQSHNLR